MPDVKLCRVCLTSGVKMFASDQYQLKQFYEEITVKKMNTKAGLPHHFCYMCAALLYKFHKFKHKCHTAESALYLLLEKGPIKASTITEKYRQDKHLDTPLNIIISNKNVRTSITKRKYSKKCEQLNKTIVDSKTIDIGANIDEPDHYISDVEEDIIKIEETIINELILKNDINDASDDQISTKTNNDNELQIIKDMTISDEEKISDNEFLSNIKTETKNNEQNSNIKTEKSTKNSTKQNKMKRKAKKPSKTIKSKRKKFEKSIKDKDNVLDPQHWLKINLSEAEAVEDHKSRANDPKYEAAVYKCTGCYKWFSREEIYLRHMKLRHDESLGALICRFCGMRYKQKNRLSKHISQHYTKFKCLRCDLVCVLETTAKFHNDSHNGVTRTCKDCGKEFRHLSTYYTHLRTHRSEHVCTICGASFVSILGLHMHKQSMHVTDINTPEDSSSMHCARCDIMFETKRAYDEHFNHSAMHSEGVQDKSAVALKRRMFNRTNKKKPSHCAICDKSFSTQMEYFSHHASEHSQQPRTDQNKVVCEICGQTLAFNSMKSHLNTHTREKIFTCSICGMTMVTKTSLNRHQLTHTGEKPFKCPLCDKRFTQKGSMQLHYRTYHLKEPYPKRNRKKGDTDEIGLFDGFRNEDENVSNVRRNRWR